MIAKNPEIFLSFGSNLGDRTANISSAINRLKEQQVAIVKNSSFYETAPELHPDFPALNQQNFINSVAQILTSKSPLELLETILQIELSMGRNRTQPGWPPRTIDIDIIAWNDLILDTSELTIPHPRMHLREFVLKPLAEIAPDWIHPVLRKDVSQLYA